MSRSTYYAYIYFQLSTSLLEFLGKSQFPLTRVSLTQLIHFPLKSLLGWWIGPCGFSAQKAEEKKHTHHTMLKKKSWSFCFHLNNNEKNCSLFFFRLIYALDMHCLTPLAVHCHVTILVTQKWQSFQATSGAKALPRIYKHSIHCDLCGGGM